MPTDPDKAAELAEWIQSESLHYQELFGLDHWTVDHVFVDEFFGDDNADDFKVTATTEGRWNYLQAKIKWYVPSAVRHDTEDLRRVLVHELCHVLMMPEQADIQDKHHEKLELSTEMVARALLNAEAA